MFENESKCSKMSQNVRKNEPNVRRVVRRCCISSKVMRKMIESLTQCDQIVQFCKVLGNFVLANVAQIFGYFEKLS